MAAIEQPIETFPGRQLGELDADGFPHSVTSTKRFFSALSPALNNSVYIKRSLGRSEYRKSYPAEYYDALRTRNGIRNEAATIEFVRRNTTIPVPSIVAAFEDRGEEYIIMEKLQDVIQLADVPLDERAPIVAELEGYIAQLHQFKSRVFGGVTGEIKPPPRLWTLRPIALNDLEHPREPDPSSDAEYVLCHGDLNTMNIMVDKTTRKIKCIIDWEYAGFYPVEFEGHWWKRDGPSVILPGEEHLENTRELWQRVVDLATPESRARVLPQLMRPASEVKAENGARKKTREAPKDSGL